MGWTVLPASRASGSIHLMWDKPAVKCIKEMVGTFSISCRFKSVLNQFIWAFWGVYGPNADADGHSV
jgi:hypothetical protein